MVPKRFYVCPLLFALIPVNVLGTDDCFLKSSLGTAADSAAVEQYYAAIVDPPSRQDLYLRKADQLADILSAITHDDTLVEVTDIALVVPKTTRRALLGNVSSILKIDFTVLSHVCS